MSYLSINLKEKLSKFDDHWSPRVVAEMNDYQLKLAKLEGEFIWREHTNTDEVFFVVEGAMCIEFRDGRVMLEQGEMFVVPKGVEHKPVAQSECKVMIIEPKGLINTGETDSGLTADNDVWV
jgi:mannose-6-phosphate isomerase-like protein (cupin superfamily)